MGAIITALGYATAAVSSGIDATMAISSLLSRIQAAGDNFSFEDAEAYRDEMLQQQAATQAAINKARAEDNG